MVSDITEISDGGSSRMSSKITILDYPGGNITKTTNNTVDLSKDSMRTYAPISHTLPPGFYAMLHQSENPLFMLYNAFKGVMSSNDRAKLLTAATTEPGQSAITMAAKMFLSVTKELEILRGLAATVEMEISKCETMAQNLIVLFGTTDLHDENLQRHSENLMRCVRADMPLIVINNNNNHNNNNNKY